MKNKTKPKFESGDFVWIKNWSYARIKPQIGIYVEGDSSTNLIYIEKDHRGLRGMWWFGEACFRKATFKETEAYLKTIMK